MRALHAEVVKFFTTKLWLWLFVTVALLTGVLMFFFANDFDEPGEGFNVLDLAEFISFVAIVSQIAYVMAATMGIIAITGEYRHQTVTPTFLATPQRSLVVLAKMISNLVAGTFFGLVFCVVVALVAFPILKGKGYDESIGVDLSLGNDLIFEGFRGVVFVCALFGLFGVGIGTLLRNQVFAVTGTILYLFVIENILLAIPSTRDLYPYLPGGAARTVMFDGIDLGNEVDLLTSGQATVVLAAWSVGLAVVGSLITISRDVT